MKRMRVILTSDNDEDDIDVRNENLFALMRIKRIDPTKVESKHFPDKH